jgi:hypothetical protein
MFRGKRVPTYLTAANRGRERRVAAQDVRSLAMWTFPERQRGRLSFDGSATVEYAGEVIYSGLIGRPRAKARS